MDNGGYFALAGVILGFVLTVLKDSYDERKKLAAAKKQIAAALLAEITALRDRYLEVYRIMDWAPGQPLMLGGFEGTNLFAVYDGNANKLGLFDSEDAKVVVRAYTLLKAHLESFSMVSDESRSFMHRIAEYNVTQNPIGKGLLVELQTYQNRVGLMLQKESALMLIAVGEARQVLERYAGG